ncbi:CD177 antigen [Sus scrofa]|uniref:CD177 antigen n=1 Tax=Sus scrofa TaxID=9823 RepID=UPI0001C95872|nr:CD177 antigen [Sus scrofa]
MSPALLLALLVVTLTLPRVQTLTCFWGSLMEVRNASELPLQWTTGQKNCEDGWGCQELLMLIENGPHVNVVIIKGCTQEANQEARVTHHRTDPGLSIASYTHVCRENLCNSLSTSLPLWTMPPTTGLGSLRCPVCLSAEGCLSAPELTCPAGSTHCYNGALLLSRGGLSTRLKVQGCMTQAGCNLLNGTREIGPISLRETCDPKDFLICHRGVMLTASQNLTQKPKEWTTSAEQLCDLGEVCQETLLLIHAGHRSLLLASKGCSKARTQAPQAISIHSRPPGVLVASYAHFCSFDKCNSASSSSVLLNSLPRLAAPAPGHLRCPTCVGIFGSCSPDIVTCPEGTSHCYNGHIAIQGGGLSSSSNIQGCVAKPSSSLLNHTRNIGVFAVTENSNRRDEGGEDLNKHILQNGAAPAPYLAWMVWLGLSLAIWCGGPSLLIPLPLDSQPLLTP